MGQNKKRAPSSSLWPVRWSHSLFPTLSHPPTHPRPRHVHRLWAAIRAVTLRGLPAPHPLLHRREKNSLDGQRVYRARQVLTDLILTGRGRACGREAWGISTSPRRLMAREGVEVQSQESSLTWQSWSRKGSRSCVWFRPGERCLVLLHSMHQRYISLPWKYEENEDLSIEEDKCQHCYYFLCIYIQFVAIISGKMSHLL